MTKLTHNPRKIKITFVVSAFLVFFASQGRSQDTVSVDFSQIGKPLVRLNQSISNTQTSKGQQDDQLIKKLGMRLERTFWSPAAWAQAGPGRYDFTAANPFRGAAPATNRDWGSDSPMLDNIIAQGAQPVICFTGEPGWDAAADTQTAELNGLPANMTQYQQLVKDGLNHLRSKYPGIQYIEVWNEPDNNLTPAQYDTLYQNVSQAVQEVNFAMPSGEPPFLVGGPAVYNPASSTMKNFISFVSDNNLELDFLSWHEYGGDIRSDAQILQNKLSSVGLNPNLPQFVTEWGYTSYNTTSIPTPSQLMVAATYIGRGWSELETNDLASIVTTFPFSQDEYRNYSRSMLVPYPENPLDGQVFPLYNVYQMMSMEKSTLVANSGVSGGTSSLFPLATEDGSGVALMLTNTAGSNVNVNLNDLPSTFQQGAFQFSEYLVDTTHSNWAYNQATSTLQEVANSTEGAASSFSTTLTMPQNSVILLVLTPGVINYPSGFANAGSAIHLGGHATYTGSKINLVVDSVYNANNAWFTTPVNVQGFTTTFTFNIVCPTAPTRCGDGLGFEMINQTQPLSPSYWSGWSGGQFSWSAGCTGATATSGCTPINAVLVKFDTYSVGNNPGPAVGPGYNLTGYYTGGEWPQPPNAEYDMAPSGINMQSGDLMRTTLTYNGSTLTETLTDTVTGATYTHTYTGVNIPAAIGSKTAIVGFGGGTGAALDQVYLDSWTYTVE